MTGTAADGDPVTFPKDFLWGAATSAHQTEGGNTGNDWWDWEHDPTSGCAEPSGDACDSLHRWPEDVDIVVGLGLGAYRFSLEWSRIEPAPAQISVAALDHYRRMCEGCLARGVQPVVTFHHFTIPRWLAARGGWESPDAASLFGRFVSSAVARLGDVIGTACTINEPNVIGVMGYMQGEYPPGVKDDFTRHLAVNDVMVRAHRLAVDALRAGPGSFPVGLTLSMDEMVANAGGEGIRDAAEEILENTFLRACAGDDFVGVQTYTRIHFDTHGKGPDDPDVPVTQMGYENWPPALAHTVRRTAAFTGLPVLVTENGIATADDAERIAFMDAALRGVGQCIRDGVDVRGYFAWSLLDNFEWNQGYRPTFGLVSVDRATFARTLKPSATWLGRVAQANVLA